MHGETMKYGLIHFFWRGFKTSSRLVRL